MKGNEPGCWLIVDNIEALYEEFCSAIPNTGVDAPRPTVTQLTLQPWGTKEFGVLDPDNNALHIGESAM